MAEFDLIARIAARTGTRDDVALGIGDDGALLQVAPSQQLVVVTDTLNVGVHFTQDTAPADIGWKALAVNLSDLAAMGAHPAWCTLALSLPAADPAWIAAFLDGFLALAQQHNVALVGGDTTRGPLSLTVTALGMVEEGCALHRAGAQPGDDLWVSGTLGDAALAFDHEASGDSMVEDLRARLLRPTPRVALGAGLRGIATACIDVSDGLLQDVGHLCTASGVGAQIAIDALPQSPGFVAAALSPERRRALQATWGDDYELCFTAAPSQHDAIVAIGRATQTPVMRIGRMVVGNGVQAVTETGAMWQPPRSGHEHFG